MSAEVDWLKALREIRLLQDCGKRFEEALAKLCGCRERKDFTDKLTGDDVVVLAAMLRPDLYEGGATSK